MGGWDNWTQRTRLLPSVYLLWLDINLRIEHLYAAQTVIVSTRDLWVSLANNISLASLLSESKQRWRARYCLSRSLMLLNEQNDVWQESMQVRKEKKNVEPYVTERQCLARYPNTWTTHTLHINAIFNLRSMSLLNIEIVYICMNVHDINRSFFFNIQQNRKKWMPTEWKNSNLGFVDG